MARAADIHRDASFWKRRTAAAPRLAISSQALDHRLGRPRFTIDAAGQWHGESSELPRLMLLDLPREASRHGVFCLELCHFHLASLGRTYLEDFRAACSCADVELFGLIVGDSHLALADASQRYEEVGKLRPWIERAARLRAPALRVRIGNASAENPQAALAGAVEALLELAEYAERKDVRIVIQNERDGLTADPTAVQEILHRCDGAVGLCADFSALDDVPDGYLQLEALLGSAASLQLQADASTDSGDHAHIQRYFELARRAAFSGPVTIINPPDVDATREWQSVDRLGQYLREEKHVHAPSVV